MRSPQTIAEEIDSLKERATYIVENCKRRGNDLNAAEQAETDSILNHQIPALQTEKNKSRNN